MKIKCPKCKKETHWKENPFRPFCSEQCSLIDLGEWMHGNYVIPDESSNGEEKGDEQKEALDF